MRSVLKAYPRLFASRSVPRVDENITLYFTGASQRGAIVYKSIAIALRVTIVLQSYSLWIRLTTRWPVRITSFGNMCVMLFCTVIYIFRLLSSLQHAAGIEESIRQAFPSIPASFQLKPVTIRKIPACGMLYDFKVGQRISARISKSMRSLSNVADWSAWLSICEGLVSHRWLTDDTENGRASAGRKAALQRRFDTERFERRVERLTFISNS